MKVSPRSREICVVAMTVKSRRCPLPVFCHVFSTNGHWTRVTAQDASPLGSILRSSHFGVAAQSSVSVLGVHDQLYVYQVRT